MQQQAQTNSLLQQLVSTSQANQISSASSFIGTSIQATGDKIGLQNGAATVAYNLATAASSVTVSIKDSSGNTVFQSQVTSAGMAQGNNTVQWNGVNSYTGKQEPDGVYTVSVTATDGQGNAITATPYVTGSVSSAAISNGSIVLDVNGLQVPVSSVTNVINLPTASTTPLSSSSSSPSSSSGSGTTPSGSGTTSAHSGAAS